MIELRDIEAAARRLSDVAAETPLLQNDELDRHAGGAVLVKAECLQRTGSFKIRGAYNLLSQLTRAQATNGAVAWSSGNHAQGVAAAGGLLGIRTTIVMPADAPRAKLESTRRLGGEIVTYDRYREDREAIARRIAAERDAAIVPSYDHDAIIAGQGTVGLEIAAQAASLGMLPDQVLVPCGGGGLSAGIAIALAARRSAARLYTVEPDSYDDTRRSLQGGERVGVTSDRSSLCDALLAPMPGALTFDILRQLECGGLVVSEAEVRAAMRFALRQLKLVVEPGGAVALAAVLAGKVDTLGRTTALVLSGGNVDVEVFAAIQAESA